MIPHRPHTNRLLKFIGDATLPPGRPVRRDPPEAVTSSSFGRVNWMEIRTISRRAYSSLSAAVAPSRTLRNKAYSFFSAPRSATAPDERQQVDLIPPRGTKTVQ